MSDLHVTCVCVCMCAYVLAYVHTMHTCCVHVAFMCVCMYNVHTLTHLSLLQILSPLPPLSMPELRANHPPPPLTDELTSPVVSFITQEHYNPLRLVQSVHSSLAVLNKVLRRSFLLTTDVLKLARSRLHMTTHEFRTGTCCYVTF